MGIWESVVLGIVQGLGEFLPISSSAHLALLPWVFGWEYRGIAYDVALHLGTLCAVLFYFRAELLGYAQELLRCRCVFSHDRLWKLALATVPAGLAGVLLEDKAATVFRGPVWMAVNLMVFALILLAADRLKRSDEDVALGYWQFFLIGCAQALSIMPGVSRSGITITAALFLGATRSRAARISFLLSIPVIFGAGVLEMRHLEFSALGADYALGFVASALSGWVAIKFVMGYVRNSSYLAFVVYRLLLGAGLLALAFSR